jgi:hypothetical protein
MTRTADIGNEQAGQQSGKGSLFGVPLGDLGWFASLLMGTALGFAAFFAATFVGIMGILVYNTAMHGSADFAWSYRRVGLPVGATVMALALGYLGTFWVRRQLRRS